MFEVTIYNVNLFKNVGPQFFVGPNEEYKTLDAALNAARKWIIDSINSIDLQVCYSSVGYL